MVTDADFLNDLGNQFPGIRTELFDEDYEDNSTLQIDVFLRYTLRLIENNDVDAIKTCLDFVDSHISGISRRYENSLVVSYLGKINFLPPSIRRLLSKRLLVYVEALENHKQAMNNDREFIEQARKIRDEEH